MLTSGQAACSDCAGCVLRQFYCQGVWSKYDNEAQPTAVSSCSWVLDEFETLPLSVQELELLGSMAGFSVAAVYGDLSAQYVSIRNDEAYRLVLCLRALPDTEQ